MSFDIERHLWEVKLLRQALKAMIIEAGQPADFSINRSTEDTWSAVIDRTGNILGIRLEDNKAHVNFDFSGPYCRQVSSVVLSVEEIKTRMNVLLR